MADPIKIPVQVALEPDIKGVQSLGMAINQAMGGQQGGTSSSGQKGPAQQLDAALEHGKASMQQMVTLSSQLQRNVTQIVAMFKQIPNAFGGGGGNGPGSPLGQPGVPAPGTPGGKPVRTGSVGPPGSGGEPNKGHWRYQGMYGVQHSINTGVNMANQGFSGSSILEGAGSIAQLFGPKGAAVGAALNALGQNMSKEEMEGHQRLRLFRQGGNQLRGQYHDLTAGSMAGGPMMGYARGSLQEAGLTKEDISQLLSRLSKDATQGNMMDVGRLEGGYGVGNEAAGLLGNVKRGGGDASRDAIARAIGLQVATGLERSRFGESFTMLSAVVTKQALADASKAGQVAGFIGTAGEQYKGDTKGFHEMLGMVGAMGAGQGGPGGEIMALSTIMGQGKSYAEAKTIMAQGGMESGLAVIQKYAEMPAVKGLWQQGKQHEAAMTVAMISGQNQNTVKDALARYYKGGVGDVTAGHMGVAPEVLNQTMLPSGDRSVIDAKNRSDYVWDRGGAFGGIGPLDASKRIARDQGSSALERGGGVGPVSSVGEFQSKYGNNYGQQRSSKPVYDSQGNMSYQKLPDGQTRTHGATDMTFPAGTPVFAAAAGTVKEVVSLGEGYGWIIAVAGDDGTEYRYTHLDQKPQYSVGDKIGVMAPLGVTIKKDFKGGSKSHLDFATKQGGKAVDPFKVLGVKGLNRLMGQAGDESAAANDSGAKPGSAPTPMPTVQQAQAAMEGMPGVAGMMNLNLLVTVDDRRVTVARAGAQGSQGGAGKINTAGRQ